MPLTGRARLRVTAGCAIFAPMLSLLASTACDGRVAGSGEVSNVPRSGQALLSEGFDDHPVGERWLDGETRGGWRAVYDGFGRTEVIAAPDRGLTMAPRSAAKRSVTHGGLATTVQNFDDVDITVRMGTLRQLRNGTPNPWEVAWLLWHYTNDKRFYYLALKPNGWEVGKEDPAYPGAQRYLATGDTPSFPIGRQRLVRVRQVGGTMIIWVNGQQLVRYTDKERPYLRGRVGLYTEDAQVLFDDVLIRQP